MKKSYIVIIVIMLLLALVLLFTGEDRLKEAQAPTVETIQQ
ncbi:MAG: hypothetical protein R3B64_01270 [Candidatus Paceibacterota bacterium]